MRLARDQCPVEYLAAQSADEAFADRVHARNLDGCSQDPDTAGCEDGVE